MEIWTFSCALLLLDVLICGSGSGELNQRSSERTVNTTREGKSLAQYARLKIANLHAMREQLEKYNRSRLSTSSYDKSFNNHTVNEEIPNLNFLNSSVLLSPQSLPSLVMEKSTEYRSPTEARNGFLSKLLPNTDILKKLSKMRETLEPSLRSFLTSKYNDFLTNLVPYSEGIGVPPFMLNSMKIPENFDPRWNYIQNLLETSSLEQFLKTLPEISSLASYKHSKQNTIQSRSDDDFISDQEPQATSKGKKKYGTLRLPARVKVYRKGDASVPDRVGAGYEYAGFGDQYGLYSTYDSAYGKGYDDYSVSKGNHYDDYPSKGGNKGSKYGSSAGQYGEAFASGHNSYSTYGGGGGHGGSYTSSLGGYMDPFSILGGLAFLVYLGLLFQQSLNMTAGRSYSDPLFTHRFGKPVELTLLNFGPGVYGRSLDFSFNNRQARSRDNERSLQEAVNLVEAIWRDIKSLKSIRDTECRHQKLCQVIKNMESRNLVPVFKEELEKQEVDRKFLYDILNQIHERGLPFDCHIKLRCEGLSNG